MEGSTNRHDDARRRDRIVTAPARRGIAAAALFAVVALAAPPALAAEVARSALAAPRAASGAATTRTGIRLVLQITVDQLRPDLLMKTRDRWSPDGLRRLFDDGTVFAEAHHAHANTETIVGHATLATGADPSVHGMIGNAWFDRAAGSLRYNIEDSRVAVVGDDGVAPGAAGHPEIRQKIRGRSPDAMLAPTIADSIAKAGAGKAKVFAVSLKDRGAVPMGGRAGKALWWTDATGEFISSTFYYPDGRLPPWAAAWNAAHAADRFAGLSWTLLLAPKTYRAAARDDMPWEEPPPGMKRTFPHRFDRRALGKGYYSAVAASPFGDELLLDFTKALLAAEDVGRDEVLDYVSVAFSSADFIGHRFGPSSLEMEDEILRLDRAIARLLRAADESAGAGRTLVVLSSDHGVAEAPQELAAARKDSGKVVLSAIESGEAVGRLAKKHGGRLVRYRWSPYLYLDNDALRAHGDDPDAVALDVAAEIAKAPGVAAAFTRADIIAGRLPDTDIARAVRRNFEADRSGDIHVVPRPGWQIAYEGEGAVRYATGHGTPWRYDTHVPLVVAGPGVGRSVVGRRVETIDVAPTIAALTGVDVPARSQGRALLEAPR